MEPGRLKKIRLEKGYTLTGLCKKTGISKGYMSQLENGLREPSLETLRTISQCLDVPLFSFFISDNEIHISGNESNNINNDMCSIIYKKNRKKLQLPEGNADYEILTPMSPDNGKKPEIIGLYSQRDPGCWFSKSMVTHDYDESILILKGTIRTYIGEDIYELQEGDSIYIKKNSPHNMFNCSKKISAFASYMIKNSDWLV